MENGYKKSFQELLRKHRRFTTYNDTVFGPLCLREKRPEHGKSEAQLVVAEEAAVPRGRRLRLTGCPPFSTIYGIFGTITF